MKKCKIGLLGAVIDNDNLGCVALTYSLIALLEKIGNKNHLNFEYLVFEPSKNQSKLEQLYKNIRLRPDTKLESLYPYFNSFANFKDIIKSIIYIPRNINFRKRIKECDFVIDLTQGDSFTDYYKDSRFKTMSESKIIVIKNKIPLILGPQTYGPYISDEAKNVSDYIFQNSYSIYSRDETSLKNISSEVIEKVMVTTDLAFSLPFKNNEEKFLKTRIGINPSGLLADRQSEKTSLNTIIKVNYSEYISKLVKQLNQNDLYEIHFISHVGNEALSSFPNIPGVIYHDKFPNPIDAKNVIASMDVFIGSRMHATIASFSSGVATIPVAYSDKFFGVFSGLGYDHVVDLRDCSTDEAVEMTLDLINKRDELKKAILDSRNIVKNKLNICFENLEKDILEILNNGYEKDRL